MLHVYLILCIYYVSFYCFCLIWPKSQALDLDPFYFVWPIYIASGMLSLSHFPYVFGDKLSLACVLESGRRLQPLNPLDLGLLLALFFKSWWYCVVSNLFTQVLWSFFKFFKLAELRVLWGLSVILFVMLKCVLLWLFHVIYVVVVFLVIMVTCCAYEHVCCGVMPRGV